MDVGHPFELRRVGVAGADVAGLQGFELLLGAEFVGLWGVRRVWGRGGRGEREGREGGEGRKGGGWGDVPLCGGFRVDGLVVWEGVCVCGVSSLSLANISE